MDVWHDGVCGIRSPGKHIDQIGTQRAWLEPELPGQRELGICVYEERTAGAVREQRADVATRRSPVRVRLAPSGSCCKASAFGSVADRLFQPLDRAWSTFGQVAHLIAARSRAERGAAVKLAAAGRVITLPSSSWFSSSPAKALRAIRARMSAAWRASSNMCA